MINYAGVVSIVLFYLLILGVGIWAGRKKEHGNDSEEEVMLAGRSIGLFVGIFTMTGESTSKPDTEHLREKSVINHTDFLVLLRVLIYSYLGWWWLHQRNR